MEDGVSVMTIRVLDREETQEKYGAALPHPASPLRCELTSGRIILLETYTGD